MAVTTKYWWQDLIPKEPEIPEEPIDEAKWMSKAVDWGIFTRGTEEKLVAFEAGTMDFPSGKLGAIMAKDMRQLSHYADVIREAIGGFKPDITEEQAHEALKAARKAYQKEKKLGQYEEEVIPATWEKKRDKYKEEPQKVLEYSKESKEFRQWLAGRDRTLHETLHHEGKLIESLPEQEKTAYFESKKALSKDIEKAITGVEKEIEIYTAWVAGGKQGDRPEIPILDRREADPDLPSIFSELEYRARFSPELRYRGRTTKELIEALGVSETTKVAEERALAQIQKEQESLFNKHYVEFLDSRTDLKYLLWLEQNYTQDYKKLIPEFLDTIPETYKGTTAEVLEAHGERVVARPVPIIPERGPVEPIEPQIPKPIADWLQGFLSPIHLGEWAPTPSKGKIREPWWERAGRMPWTILKRTAGKVAEAFEWIARPTSIQLNYQTVASIPTEELDPAMANFKEVVLKEGLGVPLYSIYEQRHSEMDEWQRKEFESILSVLPSLGKSITFTPSKEAREAYEAIPEWRKAIGEALCPLWFIPLAAPFEFVAGAAKVVGAARVALRLGKAAEKVAKAEAIIGAAPLKPAQKALQKWGAFRQMQAAKKAIKAWQLPKDVELERLLTEPDYLKRVLSLLPDDIANKIAPNMLIRADLRTKLPLAIDFTKPIDDVTRQVLQNEAKIGLFKSLYTRDMGDSFSAVMLDSMRGYHPDWRKLFGVSEKALNPISTTIRPKPLFKAKGSAIGDILEHPNWYVLTKEQKHYIREIHNWVDKLKQLAKTDGISLKELSFEDGAHYVHRLSLGQKVNDGELTLAFKGTGRGKPAFTKSRMYDSMLEGINNNILYDGDPLKSLEAYARGIFKLIAQKRMDNTILHLGQTSLERMSPQVRSLFFESSQRYGYLRRVNQHLTDAIMGKQLASQSVKLLERIYPGRDIKAILAGGKSAIKKFRLEVKSDLVAAGEQFTKDSAKFSAAKKAAGRVRFTETEGVLADWHYGRRIFPKPVSETLNTYYRDVGNKWMTKASNVSGYLRSIEANADFSAPWIQGIWALGNRPDKWAKAMGYHLAAFATPKVNARYMVQNMAPATRYVRYGGLLGATEYVTPLAGISRILGKMSPVAQKAFENVWGRFGRSFSTFGNTIRIELWKAWSVGKTEKELYQIASVINHMTGVYSSRRAGIGTTQRLLENMALFAPQYTRANTALLTHDLFAGGMTGRLARKVVARGLGGLYGTYYLMNKMTGREPHMNPLSPTFGTFEVETPNGPIYIGFGGYPYAVVRLLGGITAAVAELGYKERLDLIKVNRFDNPMLKFILSRGSPLVSGMMPLADYLLVGDAKNFYGKNLETPGQWARWAASFVTPIAMQPFVEEAGFSSQAVIAEVFGLRTFPKNEAAVYYEMLDDEARELGFKDWRDEELDRYNRKEITAKPYVRDQQARYLEERYHFARGFSKDWLRYNDNISVVQDKMWEDLEELGNLLLAGDIDIDQWRDRRAEIKLGAAKKKDGILEGFPEIQEFFDEKALEVPEAVFDQAWNQWCDMMYQGDLEKVEGYDFEERKLREQQFERKWGTEMLEMIRDYPLIGVDLPPVEKLYLWGMQILEPYFQIEWPDIKGKGKEAQEARAKAYRHIYDEVLPDLRETCPDIDALMYLFNYGGRYERDQIYTLEGVERYYEILDEWGVDDWNAGYIGSPKGEVPLEIIEDVFTYYIDMKLASKEAKERWLIEHPRMAQWFAETGAPDKAARVVEAWKLLLPKEEAYERLKQYYDIPTATDADKLLRQTVRESDAFVDAMLAIANRGAPVTEGGWDKLDQLRKINKFGWDYLFGEGTNQERAMQYKEYRLLDTYLKQQAYRYYHRDFEEWGIKTRGWSDIYKQRIGRNRMDKMRRFAEEQGWS